MQLHRRDREIHRLRCGAQSKMSSLLSSTWPLLRPRTLAPARLSILGLPKHSRNSARPLAPIGLRLARIPAQPHVLTCARLSTQPTSIVPKQVSALPARKMLRPETDTL